MGPPAPTLVRAATLVPACLDTQEPAVRSRSMNVLEILVAMEAAVLTMTVAISAPVHLVSMATTAS